MTSPGGIERGRVSVRAVPDTSRFAPDLKAYLERVERTLRVSLPTSLDVSGLVQEARRAAALVSQSAPVHLQVEIDRGASRAQFEDLRRRLSGQSVVLDVGLDRAQLAAVTGQVLKLGASLSALSLGALAGTAVTGGILALASALSQAAGAAALLPAAGAAAAVGIGALVIGLQGVGDAIAAAGDPAKFAEALKALSPEAREAAVAFKALAPQLEAFRKAVQDSLFRGLAEQIKLVARDLLPVLQRGFDGAAKAANAAAREFAAFARSPQTLADSVGILGNVNASFKALVPAGTAFAAALRDITAVGSSFLPLLASGLTAAAERFAAFVAQARDSGQLREFIGQALDTLRTLGSILGDIGSTIGAVFSAGSDAGAGFLDVVKSITEELQATAQGGPGQEALRNFFVSAKQAADALLPILGSVVQLIGNGLAPLLADIATAVGPAVRVILDAIARALQVAAPGITAFAEGFAAFLEGVAPALPAIGRLAGVLGESLGRVLEELGPVLAEVATVLSDNLAEALSDDALISGLIAIGTAFGDLVKALAPVLPDLAQLAGQILGSLAGALSRIVPLLMPLVRAFVDALAPVLPELAQAFADLAVALAPISADLGLAFVKIAEALLPILPPLVDALAAMVAIAGPVLSFLTGFASAVAAPIEGLGMLTVALTDLTGLTNEGMLEAETAFRGSLEGWAASAEDTGAVIGIALDDLLGGFRDTGTGIAAVLGQTTVAAEANDVATRIAFERTREGVGRSVTSIIDHMGFGAREGGRLGAALGTGYSAGATVGFAAAEQATRVAIAKIAAAMEASDAAYKAGTALALGLARGIAAQQAAVAQAAQNLMQAAARKFPSSPAKEGPFSGRGWTPFRGEALAEGFADGMIARVAQVRAAAASLASAASGSLGSLPAGAAGAAGGGAAITINTMAGPSAESIAAAVDRTLAFTGRIK